MPQSRLTSYKPAYGPLTEYYLVTTTVQFTVFPSIVTVIVVVPAMRAVMRPEDETVAILVDLLENLALVFVASAGVTVGIS